MGLTITSYSHLQITDMACSEYEDTDAWNPYYIPGASMDWSEREWPGRAEGIPTSDAVYSFEDSMTFRAGSYGGYGQWRDWLARVAGWGSAEECWASDNNTSRPFWELINFADNEGVIGPVIAEKLARDFAENDEKACFMGDDWLYGHYQKWRLAFEMAAKDGAVDFN